ncbi:MAG: type II toxin-antitoxin system VapC family toxin [Alphaproteobacteria bacterium]
MFLLDTNVVSETRRAKPHGAVIAWLAAAPPNSLLLSAMTVGEIQAGIERTREHDAAKAEMLAAWLADVPSLYSVLPLDEKICRLWGTLKRRKPATHFEDAMIVATALVHGLTVVTRNTRDFEGFGVPLINPFQA